MACCEEVANDMDGDVASDIATDMTGDVADNVDDAIVPGVGDGVGSLIWRHRQYHNRNIYFQVNKSLMSIVSVNGALYITRFFRRLSITNKTRGRRRRSNGSKNLINIFLIYIYRRIRRF